MNRNVILGELKSRGLSVSDLCDYLKKKGCSLTPSTFYKKIRGITQFKRPEIIAISEVLNLSNDEIMNIFFAELVS